MREITVTFTYDEATHTHHALTVLKNTITADGSIMPDHGNNAHARTKLEYALSMPEVAPVPEVVHVCERCHIAMTNWDWTWVDFHWNGEEAESRLEHFTTNAEQLGSYLHLLGDAFAFECHVCEEDYDSTIDTDNPHLYENR